MSQLKWYGYMCVSNRTYLDTVISNSVIHYGSGWLSDECRSVALALDGWLNLNGSVQTLQADFRMEDVYALLRMRDEISW